MPPGRGDVLAVPAAGSLLRSIPDPGYPSLSGNLSPDSHLGLKKLSLLLLSVAPEISISKRDYREKHLLCCARGELVGWAARRGAVKTGKRPQNEISAFLPKAGLVAAAVQRHRPCRALTAAFRNRQFSTALPAYANQEKKRLQHPRNNKRGEIKSSFSAPCAQFSVLFPCPPCQPISSYSSAFCHD